MIEVELEKVLDQYHDGPTDGVFTDGSASPNPGPGGWAAVYVIGDEVVEEAYGRDPDTTNNRMELSAIRAAFDLVPVGTAAAIYSDSNLAVQTFNEWAAGWEKRGWKRKGGPIKNLEMVQEIYFELRKRPELTMEWIPAHSGMRWNEYADVLANSWRL